jgi:WD40 repeat protein/tRNA A-37 threonylcarbamoyl transferase component Bud32
VKCGPYGLRSRLGEGASGTVWRALSPDGREVALKLLHPRTPEHLERFRREARLLAGLGELEGFVPLLDSGEAPEGAYLVMPLITGGTLRDRLARGPLPPGEVVSLARSLAGALARAHALGIVHRDLKPENVLFTASGTALVADLGLAKHFTTDTPGASRSVVLSRTGELRGTVGYGALEQMIDASSAGPAADVFAVGAILYECLVGSPAFQGASMLAVLERLESGVWDARALDRSGASRGLARVVRRALSRDPGARFADGAALLAALEAAEREPGSRRLGVVAILVAGSAVAAVALLGPWRSRPEEPRASPPPPPPESSRPRTFPAACGGFLRSEHGRLVLAALSGEYAWTTAEPFLALAFSPDGKRILSGHGQWQDGKPALAGFAMDTSVKLWDASSGEELLRLPGHAAGSTAVAFTPDGRRAVTAGGDGFVRTWDLATGQALAAFDARCGPILAAALSSDGARVVAGGTDGTLRLVDLGSGEQRSQEAHRGGTLAVAFSGDGTRAISGGADGLVRVWEVGAILRGARDREDLEVASLAGHKGAVTTVALSGDGTRALSGGADASVRVWDVAKGTGDVLAGHKAEVRRVAFFPGDRRAVSASADRTLLVWDLERRSRVRALEGHGARIDALAVSPDGGRIASAGGDLVLRLHDPASGREVARAELEPSTRIALSPDGKRALTAGADGVVRLRDAATWRAIHVLRGHVGEVHAVAFSPDARSGASAGLDGVIRLWDLDSGRLAAELGGHGGGVHTLAFTPDGTRLVSGGDNAHLDVWDLATREATALPGHTAGIYQLAITRDGRRLVSGSMDRSIKVWDLTAMKLLRSIDEAHSAVVICVTLSGDGARILSGGFDGFARIFDLETGRKLHDLESGGGFAMGVAFLPDGRAITSSYTGVIRLWGEDGALADALSLASSGDWAPSVVVRPGGREVVVGTARGVALGFESR